MKSSPQNQENTCTAFVQLDSYACTACWECIDACPNRVIDKSFLLIAGIPVHEQVLMYDAIQCTGCLKCMQACTSGAISRRQTYYQVSR